MNLASNLPLPWFLAAIAVRTVVVLGFLVAVIRVLGKREVGGLHLVDLVLVLLLGNAVQNAITSGSGILGVGIVAAGSLLLLDRALGILFVRSPWLEDRLFGEPTVLGSDGKLDASALRRERVSEADVLQAVRAQGLEDLSQVRLAVLEDDGSISIVPREDDH